MEPVTTIYYCTKSVTSIAKSALEYKKIQEIQNLRTEFERQSAISDSIRNYISIVRNDVESLMHMYFKSAYENLKYSLNSEGEIQNDYLHQARNRFIDATTLEINENLILSYIGLALCQSLLGEISNSCRTLDRIKWDTRESPWRGLAKPTSQTRS